MKPSQSSPPCPPVRLLPLACLLLFMAAPACTDSRKAEAPPEIRPVRYETLETRNLSETRTFTGQARPATEIRLGFRIAGQILELPVKMGDAVEAGQVIARLDDKDDRLTLTELEALLENARAQRDAAAASLERVRSLYAKNNVSLSDYEAAKSRHAAAAADYEATFQRLALQKSRLSYAVLLSPAQGRIARVEVETNENVQAGATVATLSTGDAILVRAGIPEAHIGGIHPGDPVEVRFSSLQNASFSAKVYEVSYVSDAQATYPVSVRLDAPDARIRPGMPAELTFHLSGEEKRNRILVPVSAILEDPEGRFVWVLTDGQEKDLGRVVRRSVTLGALIGDRFEVTEGLKPGEKIVTAGVSRLTEGMTVRHLH